MIEIFFAKVDFMVDTFSQSLQKLDISQLKKCRSFDTFYTHDVVFFFWYECRSLVIFSVHDDVVFHDIKLSTELEKQAPKRWRNCKRVEWKKSTEM